MKKGSFNPDNIKFQPSQQSIKALVNLQKNDNEALNEHINELSHVCTWIGKYLNSFDPNNKEEVKAIQAIAAISNTIVALEALRENENLTQGEV